VASVGVEGRAGRVPVDDERRVDLATRGQPVIYEPNLPLLQLFVPEARAVWAPDTYAKFK
jgi:hypothetical protein